MGERRGRDKSGNMYKGPMDKDSGGGGRGEDCLGAWVGQGRVIGGKGRQLYLKNNKKKRKY